PDIVRKPVKIKATANNYLEESHTTVFTADARLKKSGITTGEKTWQLDISAAENVVETDLPLGDDALLWDEFNPNVYELLLTLDGDNEKDEYVSDFGLREFKPDGTRFAVNGRPVFLRGTLECAIFPLTGYPPTDTEYWKKI